MFNTQILFTFALSILIRRRDWQNEKSIKMYNMDKSNNSRVYSPDDISRAMINLGFDIVQISNVLKYLSGYDTDSGSYI